MDMGTPRQEGIGLVRATIIPMRLSIPHHSAVSSCVLVFSESYCFIETAQSAGKKRREVKECNTSGHSSERQWQVLLT